MGGLRGALKDPLLSVVMPVYNERATIEEIIGRVLCVPVRIELIVVDDCSNDGTRDILQRLQAERGFSLVVATHSARLASGCRRVLRLVDGRLHALGESETADYFSGIR